MTWKNRPFIATNFLVVCILSLQYFAQNMTLTKTEKKKKIVYKLTRPQSSSRNAGGGGVAGGGVMERERGGRLSLSSFLSHPSRH